MCWCLVLYFGFRDVKLGPGVRLAALSEEQQKLGGCAGLGCEGLLLDLTIWCRLHGLPLREQDKRLAAFSEEQQNCGRCAGFQCGALGPGSRIWGARRAFGCVKSSHRRSADLGSRALFQGHGVKGEHLLLLTKHLTEVAGTMT